MKKKKPTAKPKKQRGLFDRVKVSGYTRKYPKVRKK